MTQLNKEKLIQIKPMEAMELILSKANQLERHFQNNTMSFPRLQQELEDCRQAAELITKQEKMDEFELIHMDQLGSRLERINFEAEDVIRHQMALDN